jgi:hypothetical protein
MRVASTHRRPFSAQLRVSTAIAALLVAAPSSAATFLVGQDQPNGVVLADGEALDNAANISNANGPAVLLDPGSSPSIVNRPTGVIETTGAFEDALLVNGDIGVLDNAGRIHSVDSSGVNVGGNVGTLRNSGDIASDNWFAINILGTLNEFRNSGDIEGYQGIVAFELGDFTNEAGGRIIANGSAFALPPVTGVSAGSADTFVNHGEISGTSSAVSLGHAGLLHNTGELAADPASFAPVVQLGSAGTIINQGGISGGIGGIAVQGTTDRIVNEGTIESGPFGLFTSVLVGHVVNSGDIEATNGYGALLAGGATSVVNSGTIYGSISGLNVGMFNAAPTTILNTATGLIEADPCGCGGAVEFVNGTLTNHGTIRGGTGVVVVPDGSTMGALIVNSGRITGLNGDAILFDGLDPFGADPGPGPNRDDILRLLPGSEITGRIDFASGWDTFDLTQYQGTTAFVTYRLENVISGNNPSFTASLGPDQIVVFIDTTGAKYAVSSIVGDLTRMINSGIANARAGGGAGTEGQGTLAYFPMGNAAADAAGGLATAVPGGTEVWGAAFGNLGRDTTPGSSYTQQLGGLVAGAHTSIAADVTLGGVVSVSHGRFATPVNGQVVTTDTGVVGFYGDADLGPAVADFALLGGVSASHSERQVATPMGADLALADYTSWFLSPEAGLSIPLAASERAESSAHVSVKYIGGTVGAYDELGTTFALSVPSTAIHIVEGRAELRGAADLMGTDNGTVVVSATVGGLAQSNLGGAVINLTAPGGGGPALVATDPGTTALGAYANVGVNAPIGASADLTLALSGEIRTDDVSAASASAGVSGTF